MADLVLLHGGVTIRSQGGGEGLSLCLTDLWRAAGADPSKRPAEWQRSAQAREFADFLAMGISHSELFRVVTDGPDRTTWAHWQLAIAYAKYLSPELHAYVNRVFREHIEGRRGDDRDDRLAERIAKGISDGMAPIIAPLVQKVGEIDCRLDRVEGMVGDLAQDVGRLLGAKRKDLTKATRDAHCRVVAEIYGGRCPCCHQTAIVGVDGHRNADGEFDHFYQVSRAGVAETWLICKSCHADLTDHKRARCDADTEFKAYQRQRDRHASKRGQVALFGGRRG